MNAPKVILVVVVLLALSAWVIWQELEPEQSNRNDSADKEVQQIYGSEETLEETPDGHAPADGHEHSTSSADPSLWSIAKDIPSDVVLPHLRIGVESGRLVKLNDLAIRNWSPFDIVEILVPQSNRIAEVQIVTVERLSSGNKSIKGHLVGEPDQSFIMTIGNNTVFATVVVDEGIFNIRGMGDYAWVVSTKQLRQNLDSDVQDFRVSQPVMRKDSSP